MTRITIIGGGSWGTALAIIAGRAGHDVRLWSRDALAVEGINLLHRNPRYLSDATVPESVMALTNLKESVVGAERVILAAPSHAIRALLSEITSTIEPDALLISAAKGIETATAMRMSQVAADVFAGRFEPRFVCLSGPSFAHEVAAGHPTAIVAASQNLDDARLVQTEISDGPLRIYAHGDLIGTELAGAIKNVMAIAAGMVSGLGFGSNSLAALVTRGLAEMTRFVVSFGGRVETMMGLAGLGDLVLTCTGSLSRNRFVGDELGKGRTLDQILAGMREVAEGVKTTQAVNTMADTKGIEMPIISAVNSVLYGDVTPRQAIETLMARPLKDEF